MALEQPFLVFHLGLLKDSLAYHGCAELSQVGILLQVMGYPSKTIIYLAGSEIFGGLPALIPLPSMFPNLVDHTSLCSEEELSDLVGPEIPLDGGSSEKEGAKLEDDGLPDYESIDFVDESQSGKIGGKTNQTLQWDQDEETDPND